MLADLGYTAHVSILVVCGHPVSELHAVSGLERVAQRPDVRLYRSAICVIALCTMCTHSAITRIRDSFQNSGDGYGSGWAGAAQ